MPYRDENDLVKRVAEETSARVFERVEGHIDTKNDTERQHTRRIYVVAVAVVLVLFSLMGTLLANSLLSPQSPESRCDAACDEDGVRHVTQDECVCQTD